MNTVQVRFPDDRVFNEELTDEDLENFYSFVYFSTTSKENYEFFCQSITDGPPTLHTGWWEGSPDEEPVMVVDYKNLTITYQRGTRSLTNIPSELNPLPVWTDILERKWSPGIASGGGEEGSDYTPSVDVPAGEEANLISSEVKGGRHHKIVLDIDHEAVLIPSSTPGHSHLIINKNLTEQKFYHFVRACHDIGLIADGNLRQADMWGGQFIRFPWRKLKGQNKSATL